MAAAISLDQQYRLMALDDPDLEPLWDDLEVMLKEKLKNSRRRTAVDRVGLLQCPQDDRENAIGHPLKSKTTFQRKSSNGGRGS